MTFKSLATAAVIAAFPLTALAADFSEERTLESFTKIRAEGRVDLVIDVGGPQKVSVTANREKFLKGTSTHVRNGTLIVDTEDNDSFFNLFGTYEVTVRVTMPALEGVAQYGMGDVTIRGANSETLTLSLNGMGDITVSGACGHGDFSVDGMGDLNARELKCKTVKVNLDGMGDAEVSATEFADVNSDGMGSIDVFGNPKDTKLTKDGLGSVRVHD